MKELNINYTVKVYDHLDELDEQSRGLITAARAAAQNAYTPYSRFNVGCAVRLANGEVVSGSNQENASFPAGLCAERVALSAASAIFPRVAVETMAIVVHSENASPQKPIAPCGICRQTIFEYEKRFNSDICILLAGGNGVVYELGTVKGILPLGFSAEDLPV